MLKNSESFLAEINKAKRMHVAVGLPIDKVGGAIYGDGMSVIRIGAIHEYGATFTHPGGESGPYLITIPRRSFLRVPFITKKDEMDKALLQQFNAVSTGKRTAAQALGRVGLVAENISRGAFTSMGYGEWEDIKPATKRRKGSGQPLIDTGTLRNSISSVVRKGQ